MDKFTDLVKKLHQDAVKDKESFENFLNLLDSFLSKSLGLLGLLKGKLKPSSPILSFLRIFTTVEVSEE